MATSVVTVDGAASLPATAERVNELGALKVTNGNLAPGISSQRDMMRAVPEAADLDTACTADLEAPESVWAETTDSVLEAIDRRDAAGTGAAGSVARGSASAQSVCERHLSDPAGVIQQTGAVDDGHRRDVLRPPIVLWPQHEQILRCQPLEGKQRGAVDAWRECHEEPGFGHRLRVSPVTSDSRSIPPGYLGMHVAIDQTASAKMPGRSSWTAPGIRPGDHWPW